MHKHHLDGRFALTQMCMLLGMTIAIYIRKIDLVLCGRYTVSLNLQSNRQDSLSSSSLILSKLTFDLEGILLDVWVNLCFVVLYI